jgi:ABC-2 type transport system ATP-binding protein
VFLTTHLMEEAERLCDRVAIIERGRVIDAGTPADLVRRHCPEQTVSVSTTDPAARRAFERIPGVESVAQQGSSVTLRGVSDDFVTDVIRCISEHRIRVSEFRSATANLEDVFLKLTGHSIRD